MLLLVDDAHAGHRTPPTHPERPERIGWILDEFARRGLLDVATRETAPPAPRETIEAVHDAALVAAIESLASRGGGAFDAETVVAPGSFRAATLAAGAAIRAAEAATRGEPSFALARPPGHHADRAVAQGFCLLNNVAIAAEALLAPGAARRVAIVDIDVHHGNGTQDIFYERADALYVSLHNAPLYPGTGRLDETGAGEGKGATLNLPLPHGTGEATWLRALGEVAIPAIERFAPDAVLVSAGFDAHVRDPLGMMRLTSNAYGECVRRLREVARGRVALVLEGGYDPEGLARGAASAAAALADVPLAYDERTPDDLAPAGLVERLAAAHASRSGA